MEYKKIGIDARLWNETGVGRYIRNLVKELQVLDQKNQYILFVLPKDVEVVQSSLSNNTWSIISVDIRWHSLKEQLKFARILEKENLDLVHFPYFSVPIFYKGPFVVTIHDLILHHYPTGKASTLPSLFYWSKQLAYRYIITQAAHKAKKIITVSHATEERIVKDLHVPKEKIAVTYEGIDEKVKKGKGTKSNEYGNYFLYVGNAYPHKNLERLVEAFQSMKYEASGVKGLKLILVGKEDYFYKRLKEKVVKINLPEDILFKHFVSDEELCRLYAHAKAVVVPSLMEGFGLPGLEAMSQNCLVLASNIPSLREIYQDGAIYFDPINISDIAKCMENVDNMTSQEKNLLLKKGTKQIQQFSWKKMAAQTLDVYESCIGL